MSNSLNIPDLHQRFIDESVSRLKEDRRILGVAAGGSVILGTMDEFSDLDLVIVVEDDSFPVVMETRKSIAANIGPLLESFTGEHVGESRLLICLYGPPLIHIDLKFVSLKDINDKVENPVILWEREQLLSEKLYRVDARFPEPNPDWIEERFWIWVHYCAGKIARGELFEALDFLSFLRNAVLGPLLLQKNNARPQGVHKIEFQTSPDDMAKLMSTIATHNPESCYLALSNAIALYKELRTLPGNKNAEKHVVDYVNQLRISKTT